MSERPARRRGRVTTGRVLSVERITGHMVRIVLGGPGLVEFSAGEFTDHYIKLLFLVEGVDYPEPFDLQEIRAHLPRAQWPVMRTYTVRRWNSQRRELTIDVLQHGDEGVAGPWSGRVQPGDEVHFSGPGGGYTPRPDADWHLLAGDESATPAIAASLERLPAAARAHVFIEVSGPDEEQKLETPGYAEIHWLHRGDNPIGAELIRAVSELQFPPGAVQAFVHGEAGFVKELRRLLFVERGVAREGQSISGYWRIGQDEDAWQATKRDMDTDPDGK